MHLHHGPQNKEVCRRSYLDILHRTNDCAQRHALTIHHGARVYVVMAAFLDGLSVGHKNVIQPE